VPWTVYLARCSDGSLYTGITTDPIRRVAEHNSGSGAAYTRTRRPIRLVYWETADDRPGALRREYAIRRLTRKEKEALVRLFTFVDGRSSEPRRI
jgi:putative endonuclease